ncbi:hypothetical protein EV702DRAFT_1048218 [Suillus placidus]|uniref:Uncharacterized protein n=1 Tax=Suillus placidus TaxID=48579 RepID=A0A9P6ZPF4_9AGAM|nr:hypothetical protein EV702DRAFT_1048218 [Suillus placidus]
MSDIAPLQSMIPPGSSSPAYPELRYNDAGNSYACNDAGAWVPHPRICKAITTSQPSFHIEHGEPQLSLSCEQYVPSYTDNQNQKDIEEQKKLTYHQGGRPGNGYPVSGFGGHGGQHQLHYYKGSLNVVVGKALVKAAQVKPDLGNIRVDADGTGVCIKGVTELIDLEVKSPNRTPTGGVPAIAVNCLLVQVDGEEGHEGQRVSGAM